MRQFIRGLRALRFRAIFTLALAVSFALLGLADDNNPYDPSWASTVPTRQILLDYNTSLSQTANGAALKAAILALLPGDQLLVGSGTYSVNSLFQVGLVGTAANPIRIEAMPGQSPVLTRPNANQNVINLGTLTSGPTRFVLLRGFEITGGSIGVRIQDCEDLWVDRCHIHHTGAVTVRASDTNTARLTFTRNHIHHASTVNDTGEGLYLGANNAAVITHHTVVALNHVHDMFVNQGDGIELKQGSHSCWIAENLVHDTNYPGILAYGTNGAGQNLIEGNIVYNSNDNPIQVQGEAIVRNNLAFGRGAFAFSCRDHQGQVTNLEVVHNTFVATTGRAMRLEHWGGKPGMVLANNALYSQSGYALFVQGNLSGAAVGGNVVHGLLNPGAGGPFAVGNGLSDFVGLAWPGMVPCGMHTPQPWGP